MKMTIASQHKEFSTCAVRMREFSKELKARLSSTTDAIEQKRYAYALRVCEVVQGCITEGERFYLPGDFEILKGNKQDEELRKISRPPFGLLAVLSDDALVIPGKPKGRVAVITCAVAINEPGAERVTQVLGRDVQLGPGDYFIYSVIKLNGEWSIIPQIGIGRTYTEVADFVVPESPFGSSLSAQAGEDLRADFWRLRNLFVMLNLHNVRAASINAPQALNAKRQRRGELPLYSFKVLVVDGESWTSSSASASGEKRAVRSHMRRGHIRRLDETRRVWVRATVVHGSAPGFVDKLYNVGGALCARGR